MKLLIDGVVFDSTKVAVKIVFDEKERDMFNGMRKYVSAPPGTTKEELDELMDAPMPEVQ